jgi:hypothetical protein
MVYHIIMDNFNAKPVTIIFAHNVGININNALSKFKKIIDK